jgi:hypothetical protein
MRLYFEEFRKRLHALATENIDRSRPARTRIPGDDRALQYLHSLQNVQPCHAKPAHRLCLCRTVTKEIGRRRSGSGVWTVRRTRSSAASTFLPPTFSLRLYYLASAAAASPRASHGSVVRTQIPRQDLINPPSFVIDRSPSQTYQAQQNVATGLHLQSDFGLCFYFYHTFPNRFS